MELFFLLPILYTVVFAVITFGYCFYLSGGNKLNVQTGKAVGPILLLVIAVLGMALLPVPNWTGVDRAFYANNYIDVVSKGWESQNLSDKDWGFWLWTFLCSIFKSPQIYFIITAFVYAFNHYKSASRLVPNHVFIMTLLMFGSFSFYAYGVNTIRAGFAASFLMLGLTYYRKPKYMFLLMYVACAIHFSMIIPTIAALIARFYNKTNTYLYFWFFCVALSAVAGNSFNELFASMGDDTDRRVKYLTADPSTTHYKMGFRIDFIIYSCVPVIMGYWYKMKCHYRDAIYSFFHNTYIIANAFWILVIRANYSDRFAYLSWFIYAIVLLYPVLKDPQRFTKPVSLVVKILVFYQMFMLVMTFK